LGEISFGQKTKRLEQQSPTTGIERCRQEQQALSASIFIQIKRKIKNENEKRTQQKSFIKQIWASKSKEQQINVLNEIRMLCREFVYKINKSPVNQTNKERRKLNGQ